MPWRIGSIERVDRPKPWRARYRGPDGRFHSKSFPRKVDAERWLKVSEAEALTRGWVDPTGGAKPFGPCAEDWIAFKRSRVGETTATNTEALLWSRVLPEFGGKTLKQITAPVVRKWVTTMSEEGLAPSTVYTYWRVLSQILDQAVDDGLIVTNPAKKAKAPAIRPRRQLFLTAEELRRLADECGSYEKLVWFLGWSGVRFGEAGVEGWESRFVTAEDSSRGGSDRGGRQVGNRSSQHPRSSHHRRPFVRHRVSSAPTR